MSVASRNAFALLDDDGSSPAPAQAAPQAPAPAAPPAPARGTQNKTRGGPAARGGKYYNRGGKPAPRDGAGNLNQNGIEEPASEGRRAERGGRGRGAGRGRGRGGSRPFDRHSQTGKTDSDKKIHQGWGGDEGETELKAENAAVTDATLDAVAETTEQAPEGEDKGSRPRREAREPEEEDNTLTLDQYLAQKKAAEEAALPKIEGLRIANEGAADDLWKDAVPLEKADEQSYFAGKSKNAPKQKAKKEEKVYLEIDGRFDRPSTRGRGRGGDRGVRGGGDRGRGARGRGGRGRANGAAAPTFSVTDESAFPALA